LIYFLLKPFIRFAIAIFCPDLQHQNKKISSLQGPVLITANHPNSFLDAIIIATIFDQPIHFLARGDAFHKPWHNFLLRTLHMFPIYRLKEGKEYLGLNAAAFENSRQVLSKNGIVLIFIEGICLNKHELQPFKKGAARIASTCWKEGIPVQVLPLGIAYSSFDQMGKSVIIQTSELLQEKQLMQALENTKNFILFNQQLFQKIQSLIHIPESTKPRNGLVHFLGMIGTAIHLPLYRLLSGFVRKKTKNTVFYDSVLFGLLFCCYPLYLIVLGILLGLLQITVPIVLLILIAHPVLAYFATSSKISTRSELSV
jgi:1-acyl-sn-glycerol-3-phosphate acyltransferase